MTKHTRLMLIGAALLLTLGSASRAAGREEEKQSPALTLEAQPVAVRYAYTQRPEGCMLYNKDGLPAAPFTTEQGEERDAEDVGRAGTP